MGALIDLTGSQLSKGWAVEKVLATKKFTRHRSHEYA